VQYRGLDADTLQIFEPQLLQAAVKEANNPIHVPPGELRQVNELDDYGALKTIKFIGQDCFVKQMMPPSKKTTLRQIQHTAEKLIRMVK
jgi:hypothetical protein